MVSPAEVNEGRAAKEAGDLYLRYDGPAVVLQEFWAPLRQRD